MAFQGDSIYWVEVEKIVPNPFQPRREFDEQKLKELSESVRMYGILQPLTVTRKEIQREDGTFYTEYELIAGERRLRASKLAGLAQVPVIIREGEESEQEKLELAIIENLQREDLNSVDRAMAFKQLVDVFGLSHIQVARKVGRSREYVSNTIRLLGLPDYMLTGLQQGDLTEGHARALLMLNDRPEEQDVVFREILLKKISVRETERIVRKIAMEKVRKKSLPDFDTELIEIEKRFMETLGTRVQIQKTEYGGRLTIDYFNVDDLEDMLKRMKSDESVVNSAYTRVALSAAVPLADIQLTEGDASSLSHTPVEDDSLDLSPADVVEETDVTSTPLVSAPEASAESVPTPSPANDSSTPPNKAILESPSHHLPQSYVPPLSPVVVDVESSRSDTVTNQIAEPAGDTLTRPNTPLGSDTRDETVVESDQSARGSDAKSTDQLDTDDSNLYSIRNFTI